MTCRRALAGDRGRYEYRDCRTFPWHDRHADAADTCQDGAAIPAHALLEAYATLTLMPEPLRISGQVAAQALVRAWGGRTTPRARLWSWRGEVGMRCSG